jgi:hypothetical protein
MIRWMLSLFSRPKLIAVYAFRYDAELVPDLRTNLDFVDDFIAHDDSQNPDLWYNEGAVRNSLIERARAAGGDWVICVDPDERFEKDAGQKIRELIRKKRKVVYGFPLWELYRPDAFRTDGVWSQKCKWTLFPLLDGQQFMNVPLHSQWSPRNEDYSYEKTDIRVYHLKMIEAAHREQRRRLYNALDAEKQFQAIGYDYLTDESSMTLQQIEPGRGFDPPYQPFEFKVL